MKTHRKIHKILFLASMILLTVGGSWTQTSESPYDIVASILGGMRERRHVRVEHDRERAIRMAIGEAKAGDIVLIAGKGHETEQIIGAERRPFSDRGIVSQILHGETGSEVSHGHA